MSAIIKKYRVKLAGSAGNTAKDGFTLLEVVLALLVVAIGVLAVFGLISFGLDASQQGVNDTLSALFADDVFNGLRASSIAASDDGKWLEFWQDFSTCQTSVTFAAWRTWDGVLEKKASLGAPTWSTDGPVYIKCTKSDQGEYAAAYRAVLKCKPFVGRPISTTNLINHTIRYALEVRPDSSSDPRYFGVTLTMWPGEFGDMTKQRSTIFYSEFGDPGNM